jgi:RNA polymerase sigma factor (sigma-70 family)
VLAALARRFPGQFELCEDAVQDTLLRAHASGLAEDPPGDGIAWLYVASRNRLIDLLRSEASRRNREFEYATNAPEADGTPLPAEDDSLELLFLCCHPALSPSSQVALTLRSVGGLSTAQIAAAFLVPEATVAQRIARAKRTLREAGARFDPLTTDEQSERMPVVRAVLYAIFSEGHLASSGDGLFRADLAVEGIRLARMLQRLAPDDAESVALLALMLLTDARRAARLAGDGSPIPLEEQDRSRWDRAEIDEGHTLLLTALRSAPVGEYGLQATIAAVHADAASVEETDWPQILALYTLLEKTAPSPMTTLNRVVALAMVNGPEPALATLETLTELSDHHRLHAVRAHLLERAGRTGEAVDEYRAAARGTLSLPEQRYLRSRAARLDEHR